MRIAHVNDIANVPATLTEGLRLSGHDAELFSLELIGGKYPTWFKAFFLPWRGKEMSALNQHILKGRFDVVHIHFAYLGWAGILGKYPYFLHCHGTDVRRNLHKFYQRPFISRSLKQAERVFFSTPDLAEHVLPVRPDAVWLPNPTNTEHFRPGDSPVNDSQPCPRVLFISALSRIKGVDRAFEVISVLQKQRPEIEIAVMGFGDQLSRYAQWPGIKILPRVSYKDMPALIQNYDIVVGQLHLGILSMSEQEAMACGKPVVGEFRYPEIYPEFPPLLTGETPEDLADKIVHLLDDKETREKIGQSSREWVVKYHDFRKVAQLLEEYYVQVVSNRLAGT